MMVSPAEAAALRRLAPGGPLADAALDAQAHGLRGQGVVRTQAGWLLPGGLELLDGERLRAALRQREPALRLHLLETVDSTNQWLLARAPDGVHRAVVTAECQTAGRGRRGRNWSSPFGRNVYLSMGRLQPGRGADLRGLSLAVGVAAAEAIACHCGVAVALKWPNDLYVDGRKLGGILIESRLAGPSVLLVTGVGINVTGLPEAEAGQVSQPWTSLASHAPKVSRNGLLEVLVPVLWKALEAFERDGFAAARAGFAARDLTRDRAVRGEAGGTAVRGVARGVDDQGALRVETADGLVLLDSGEVSLRLEDQP